MYVNVHAMCAYVCGKFVCGLCILVLWGVSVRCAFVSGREVCFCVFWVCIWILCVHICDMYV